ncbi:MAG: hypothetical protein HY518_04350, partial [Candidatus Aenigmarchaeota archaeon]|nr:hypothetical protein [Candidatus Aenigmarchaeota archaeon]
NFGTNQGSFGSWNFSNSSILDGKYSANITVTDAAGHSNSSVVTFTIDDTNPAVTGLTINDSDNATRNDVFLNITAVVTDANLNNSAVAVGNTTMKAMGLLSGNLFSNISNLSDLGCASDGQCTLRVSANDTLGNSNSTTSLIVTVDNTVPSAITTVSPTPANSTNTSYNFLYVNISFTETNPSGCIVEFGNSTGTVNLSNSTSTTNCIVNITGQSVGTFNYTVIVNDSVGNQNRTGKFFGEFRPDIQVTAIGFNTTDPANHASAGSNITVNATVLVNGSFDAAAPINLTLSLDGTLAASSLNTTNLTAGSSQTVVFPQITEDSLIINGNHTLLVSADTDRNVSEANEGNNNFNRSIFIGYNLSVLSVSNTTVLPNQAIVINVSVNFSNGDPVSTLNSSSFSLTDLYLGASTSGSISAFDGTANATGRYSFNYTVPTLNSSSQAQFGIHNITIVATNGTFSGNSTSGYNITAPHITVSFSGLTSSIDLDVTATDLFTVSVANNGNVFAYDVWINLSPSTDVSLDVTRCGPIASLAPGATNSTECSATATYTAEETETITANANGTANGFTYKGSKSSSVSVTDTSGSGGTSSGGGSGTTTCSSDASCASTQICVNSKCSTLICTSGTHPENHVCVPTASNVVIGQFDSSIEGVLGNPVTTQVKVKNEGTDTATGNLVVVIDVAQSVSPSTCNLLAGSECTFYVTFTTENSTRIGNHSGTLEAFASSDTSAKDIESFILTVIPTQEKEDEITSTFQNITAVISGLVGEFNSIKSSSQNSSDVEQLINTTNSLISEIQAAISAGDFVTADARLSDLVVYANRLRAGIVQLKAEGSEGAFNLGFWIMVGVIVAGVVGFLVYMLLPPKEIKTQQPAPRQPLPERPPAPPMRLPVRQRGIPGLPPILSGQRAVRTPPYAAQDMGMKKSAELFYRKPEGPFKIAPPPMRLPPMPQARPLQPEQPLPAPPKPAEKKGFIKKLLRK